MSAAELRNVKAEVAEAVRAFEGRLKDAIGELNDATGLWPTNIQITNVTNQSGEITGSIVDWVEVGK